MNCLSKLIPIVAVTTLLSACGVLEWNTDSSASNRQEPLFTSSNDVGKRTIQSDSSIGTPIGGESIKQIFQTDRCNDLSRGGFIWFTDEVVLNDWLSPLGPALVKQVRSQVDFSSQGALLVDFGVAASSGAGVEMLSDRLVKSGSEAIFKIKQNKAQSKDKKRIQMVTHPCYVYVMPRKGFDTLVIHSEQGDRLTSFTNGG